MGNPLGWKGLINLVVKNKYYSNYIKFSSAIHVSFDSRTACPCFCQITSVLSPLPLVQTYVDPGPPLDQLPQFTLLSETLFQVNENSWHIKNVLIILNNRTERELLLTYLDCATYFHIKSNLPNHSLHSVWVCSSAVYFSKNSTTLSFFEFCSAWMM